ncbi:unnamed protein product [Sphagnum balticum]
MGKQTKYQSRRATAEAATISSPSSTSTYPPLTAAFVDNESGGLVYGLDYKGNVCGDRRAKPNLNHFQVRPWMNPSQLYWSGVYPDRYKLSTVRSICLRNCPTTVSARNGDTSSQLSWVYDYPEGTYSGLSSVIGSNATMNTLSTPSAIFYELEHLKALAITMTLVVFLTVVMMFVLLKRVTKALSITKVTMQAIGGSAELGCIPCYSIYRI